MGNDSQFYGFAHFLVAFIHFTGTSEETRQKLSSSFLSSKSPLVLLPWEISNIIYSDTKAIELRVISHFLYTFLGLLDTRRFYTLPFFPPATALVQFILYFLT